MPYYIAGPAREAASTSCLIECAGEHCGCVITGVTLAPRRDSGVENLDSDINRSVFRASLVGHLVEFTPVAGRRGFGGSSRAASLNREKCSCSHCRGAAPVRNFSRL